MKKQKPKLTSLLYLSIALLILAAVIVLAWFSFFGSKGELVYSNSDFTEKNYSGKKEKVEFFEGVIGEVGNLGVGFALIADKEPVVISEEYKSISESWGKKIGIQPDLKAAHIKVGDWETSGKFSNNTGLTNGFLKNLNGKRVKIEGKLWQSSMAPGWFVTVKSMWLMPSRKPSKYDFEVKARFVNDLQYELDIVRLSDNKVIQTISVRNAVDLTKQGTIELIDLNNDGFKDLRVIGGYNGEMPWYKAWYFDSKTQTFVWQELKQYVRVRPNFVLNLWNYTQKKEDEKTLGFEVSIDGEIVERLNLSNDDSITTFLVLANGKHKVLAVSYDGNFGRGIAFKKETDINVEEGKAYSLDFYYGNSEGTITHANKPGIASFGFKPTERSSLDLPSIIRSKHEGEGQGMVLVKTEPNFLLEPPVGSYSTAAPAVKATVSVDGISAEDSNFALTLPKGTHALQAEGLNNETNEVDYFEAFFELNDETTANHVYLDFLPLRSRIESARKVFASPFTLRIAQQQARWYQ